MENNKKDMGMDAVDEKQQREIDATRVWLKAMSILLAVVILLAIGFFIMFTRAISCPHTECPHHIAEPSEK